MQVGANVPVEQPSVSCEVISFREACVYIGNVTSGALTPDPGIVLKPDGSDTNLKVPILAEPGPEARFITEEFSSTMMRLLSLHDAPGEFCLRIPAKVAEMARYKYGGRHSDEQYSADNHRYFWTFVVNALNTSLSNLFRKIACLDSKQNPPTQFRLVLVDDFSDEQVSDVLIYFEKKPV